MIRRTLTLELESGKALTVRSVEEGLQLALGKAETILTAEEVSELQAALREVAGSGGPASVTPVQPPPPPSSKPRTEIGKDQGGFTVRPQ